MFKKIAAALAAALLFALSPLPAQAQAQIANEPGSVTETSAARAHEFENRDGFLNVAGLKTEQEILDALDERLFALAGKQSQEEMDYLHSLDYSTALVADDGTVMSVVVMVTDNPEETGSLVPMGIWWVAPGCSQTSMCLRTFNNQHWGFDGTGIYHPNVSNVQIAAAGSVIGSVKTSYGGVHLIQPRKQVRFFTPQKIVTITRG